MARTYRRRQFTVEPGDARDLGTFWDAAGVPIVVSVAVRGCDDEARGTAGTSKGPGRWEVDLPPDTSLELDGLQEEDGTKVRVTVVAGPCPGRGGPRDIEHFESESSIDIDAVDVVAEVDFGDDPGIAAGR